MIEVDSKEVAATFRDLAYLARSNDGLRPPDKVAVSNAIKYMEEIISDIRGYETNELVDQVLVHVEQYLSTVVKLDSDTIDVAQYLGMLRQRIEPWLMVDLCLSDDDKTLFEDFFESLADHVYPLDSVIN